MFQKQLDRDPGGTREINMTPLIDVSLVLVTMLMFAMPMTFESTLNVRPPKASSDQGRVENPALSLRVVSEDSVEVENDRMRRSELSTRLRLLFASSETRQVMITCADEVSHGAFVNVLDQARSSGAAEIAVGGH